MNRVFAADGDRGIWHRVSIDDMRELGMALENSIKC